MKRIRAVVSLGFVVLLVGFVAWLIYQNFYASKHEQSEDSALVETNTAVPVAQASAMARPSSATQQPRVLWEAANPSFDFSDPNVQPPTPNAASLRITDTPKNWVVGTDVAILVPQLDREVVVTIQDISLHAFGSRTYVGSGTDSKDQLSRLVATTTGDALIASLIVNTQTFHLETESNGAWLIPKTDQGHHVDYSISDLERPPRKRYDQIPRLSTDN